MIDTTVPSVSREDFPVSNYYLQFLSQNLLDPPLTYASMALFTQTDGDTGIVGFYEGEQIPPPNYDKPRKNIYIRMRTSSLSTVIDLLNSGGGIRIYRTAHAGSCVDSGILTGRSDGPPPDMDGVVPELGKVYTSPHQFTISPKSFAWTEGKDADSNGQLIPILTFYSGTEEFTGTAYFHHKPFVGTPSFDESTGHCELHFPISVAHAIYKTIQVSTNSKHTFDIRCISRLQARNDELVWVTGIDTPKYVPIS